MKKSKLTPGQRTIVFFTVFIFYTMLIKLADVKAIGPLNSSVGFAALNGAVANLLGRDTTWYTVSKLLGILSILAAAGIAGLTVLQFVRTHGRLYKMDPTLISLCVFYVIVVFAYLFFEIVVINYRPVIMDADTGLEASYPSSHTLLVLCIFGSAYTGFDHIFRNKSIVFWAKLISAWLMFLMVLARTLSGVHWITDIIGGILLSCALLSLYHLIEKPIARICSYRPKKHRAPQEEPDEFAVLIKEE